MRVLLLFSILAAGCFPMRATVRREQAGTIVDRRTGLPVAGAVVVIESWQVATPPRLFSFRELLHTVEARTDDQGQWRVSEENDWKLAILAADGFPYFMDSACVIAPDYETAVMNPWAA